MKKSSENTILIVDDNLDFISLQVELMNLWGYDKIITASNGKEAVSKYKEHLPNLVLMDVNMPEMSGISTFYRIKEFDKNANVIFLTADPWQQELTDLKKEYAVQVLSKGESLKFLKPIIQKYLKIVLN